MTRRIGLLWAIGISFVFVVAANAWADCAVVIVGKGEVHHIGNSSSLWPSYPVEGTSWSTTFDVPGCMSEPFRLTLDVYDCELEQGDLGEVRINGMLIDELPDANVEPDPPPEPSEADWVHCVWELTPAQAAILQPQRNTFWIQGGGSGLDDMLFRNVVLTPEPTTLCLLAVGGCILLRRR